jgi:hypothetical protein
VPGVHVELDESLELLVLLVLFVALELVALALLARLELVIELETPVGGEINTVLVKPWEGCTGVELVVLEQFDPEESILQVTPSGQYP